MTSLKLVYQPFQIGRVTIPNRIVRSAHGTFIGMGRINDDLIAYHVARAKGGVGLSFLEIASVHPSSCPPTLHSFDDSIIDGYLRIKAATAPYGMVMFQQLAHGGVMYPGMDGVALSASTAPSPIDGRVPMAMTREQIAEVVRAFAQSARRCEEGGIEGVEIHAGHGYLLHEFLSPLMNRRDDEYGGTLENRTRFLREALQAAREAVSPGFPIGIRLSDEVAGGGLSVEDCAQLVRSLENDRLIDFIHGSQGSYYALPNMLPAMEFPLNSMLPSSGRIVGAAKQIPRILTTGRIRTLEEAEQLLREQVGDLIVVQRAHIADPDLVRKTREGRVDEVRPCISCNQGCVGGLLSLNMRLGCAVNPAVGFEQTLAEDLIVKTVTPKKVLVVGGGTAGMEAARLAALSGHQVTLVEASSDLGGTINVAKLAPWLHGLADMTLWQERELYRLGVTIRTNTYMETSDVLAERADAVIIATGSMPRMDGVQAAIPGVPTKGVGLPHVISTVDLLTTGAMQALPRTALVFDDVGHNEALSAAQWLVGKGVAVTFATRFGTLAPTVATWTRVEPQLERLLKGQFTQMTRMQLVEIKPDVCMLKPLQGDTLQTVSAEIVVLGLSRNSIHTLYAELQGKVPVLKIVGDARTPRDLQAAIREGHMAGRFIP